MLRLLILTDAMFCGKYGKNRTSPIYPVTVNSQEGFGSCFSLQFLFFIFIFKYFYRLLCMIGYPTFVCFDLITTLSEVKLTTNVFFCFLLFKYSIPVAGPILHVDESTLKLVYKYSFARQRLMLRNISEP